MRLSLRTPGRALLLLALLTLVAAHSAAAQGGPPDDDDAYADSLLRHYDLEEVVIYGENRVEERIATVQRLPLATIEQAAAPSAAQLARYVPSAHVTTNSRGETLLYMRSAGERQTALFFDGALLNIPWDNRLDLGLIPAGVIGGMTVAKGAAAIEYGANVLGGAVNLTSPTLSRDGRFTEVSALYGRAGTMQGHGVHRGRSGAFSYAAAAGYTEQDGIPLPDGAELPFNQTGDGLRTNTDRRIANAFGQGVYRFEGGSRVGVTLLHIDAEQGVAPEGHVPLEDARLWRYPDWRYTLGIVSGDGPLAEHTRWKATAWVGDFGQTIDAYDSIDFDRATERQVDDDLTLGTRLGLAHELGAGTLRLTANGLVSTHHQRDLELGEDGAPLDGEAFPRMTYRQHLLSAGAAYERPLTDRLQVTVSGSYDVMRMPRTGDKPDLDPFTDYSLMLGARYDAGDGVFVRGAAGRKTRFPTMRELFGESLNRFLINTDLKPESALLAEVGVGLERDAFRVEAIPFVNYTSDSIDRQNVTVDGRRLRQRINLDGSRVYGVELVADVSLPAHLRLAGYLTLMDVARRTDDPDESTRLAEKPEALGVGRLLYAGPQGLSALVETVYTGRAYSLGPDNDFVRLDPSTVFNVRLGYRVDALAEVTPEVFFRADNLTDELVLTQLGLPGAGRMLRAGVEMSF